MKGNPRSFYGQIRMEDLDPLFMTNKNLGIRKTPQTVMEFQTRLILPSLSPSSCDNQTRTPSSSPTQDMPQDQIYVKFLSSRFLASPNLPSGLLMSFSHPHHLSLLSEIFFTLSVESLFVLVDV